MSHGRAGGIPRLLISLLLPFVLGSCSGGGDRGGGGCSPTCPPPPPTVAKVVIAPDSAIVALHGTHQFAATVFDANGNPITGRTVTWMSDNTAYATVSSTGLVTATGEGSTTIRASVDNVSGAASVRVPTPPAAEVALSPQFIAIDAGSTSALTLKAVSAEGDTLRAPVVTWSTTAGAAATVSSAGVVTAVAPGLARVVGRVDAAADTAIVAVLGPATLLSTAFVGGNATSTAQPGAAVTIPLVLDMTRASSTGDLGAVDLELTFDPAVLVYDTAASTMSGSIQVNLASPGRVRLSLASTAVQGVARFTLATLSFHVASGVPAPSRTDVGITFTHTPVSTGFGQYTSILTAGGRLRIRP